MYAVYVSGVCMWGIHSRAHGCTHVALADLSTDDRRVLLLRFVARGARAPVCVSFSFALVKGVV